MLLLALTPVANQAVAIATSGFSSADGCATRGALVTERIQSKGGSKNGNDNSSFILVMYADINGNTLPDWGDTVTFNVSTTATTEPHVDLTCSRNGDVVYGATTGYYASYPWPWTQFMTLSSTAWQSGAADCTAELYYFSGKNARVLKSISFIAGP